MSTHTEQELYDHRSVLFITLSNLLTEIYDIEPITWKSKLHSDGTSFDGYFIAGIFMDKGKQITYHFEDKWWSKLRCEEIEFAPLFDGHTSEDVLNRLLNSIS